MFLIKLIAFCVYWLETFRNATLTVTVTVRSARRQWRHQILCIWNAPNRRSNRKCHHMTVSAAANRRRFTVSRHAKFQLIFHENGIDLLFFNNSCQNVLPIYNRVYKIIFVPINWFRNYPFWSTCRSVTWRGDAAIARPALCALGDTAH